MPRPTLILPSSYIDKRHQVRTHSCHSCHRRGRHAGTARAPRAGGLECPPLGTSLRRPYRYRHAHIVRTTPARKAQIGSSSLSLLARTHAPHVRSTAWQTPRRNNRTPRCVPRDWAPPLGAILRANRPHTHRPPST